MRAALLALLLASSAWAAPTAHYVSVSGSQAGSTAWTNSTNPLDPCALSVANGFATSGDSVIVADGIYSNAIAPSATGVIFVGNTTDPASVSVSGITPKNDAKVCGVMSRSGVTFPRLARRVVLEDFIITGTGNGLNLQDAEACRASRGSISGPLLVNNLAVTLSHAQLDTLEDLSVTYSGNSSLTLAMGKAYDATSTEIARVEKCLFRRVRIVTAPTTTLHFGPVKLFRTSSCRFEGVSVNYSPFTTTTDGNPNEPERAWVIRDSSAGNTFVRDTLIVRNLNKVHVWGFGLVSGIASLNQKTSDNSFDSCVVKIDNAVAAWLIQDKADNTRILNCQMQCRVGTAFSIAGSGGSGPGNGLVLVHNTLYAPGGSAFLAAWSGGTSIPAPTGSQWSGNVFFGGASLCTWRRDTSTTTPSWNSTNAWASDSSVIYRIDGNASGAVGRATCFATDSRATWANPAFLDTAWATLNLRPGPGSAAVSAAFPGGYAGHYDPNTIVPPADTEAPARVDDLSGAAVGTTSAALTWTASGDDNRAGTATTTYVKQHTAAINTESDWTAATTIATISGGSNSTGGEQQSYAATGLSAATTYWFCVRSLDEVPNAGSVGNTISVTTSATPDTMPPSPISNLTATALTSTSVLLSWTAPGGDRSTGQASTYVIRYRAGTTLTEAQWAAATNIAVNPTPSPAGAFEEWTVGGLSASTTYTFAIKASDAVPNQSVISNPATVVTQGVPAAPPGPLTYGNNRRRRR